MEAGPDPDLLDAAYRAVILCGIAMLEDETTTLHTAYDSDGFTGAALICRAEGASTIISIMRPPG